MAGGADQDIFIIKCRLEVTTNEFCKELRRATTQAARLRRPCDLLSLRRQHLEPRVTEEWGKPSQRFFWRLK